jgi:hypothetical protein
LDVGFNHEVVLSKLELHRQLIYGVECSLNMLPGGGKRFLKGIKTKAHEILHFSPQVRKTAGLQAGKGACPSH